MPLNNNFLIPCLLSLMLPCALLSKEIQEERETSDLKPYKKQFLSILSDNDAYFNPYVDEYYTAGSSLSYTSREYDSCPLSCLSLNASSAHLSRFHITFNQSIYTPKSHDKKTGDFPYAGFLNLSFGISHRRQNSLENLRLQIGFIGPAALAWQTQILIHKLTHNPFFHDWNSQLKNEFALNFYYEFIYRYTFFHLHGFEIDALPEMRLALGNIAGYVGVGSRLRIGYHLKNDFGVQKINSSSFGSHPHENSLSFYLFGGIMGYCIARDVFVQGNSFSPTQLELTPLQYQAELGASIAYKGFSFSYVFTQNSRQFSNALPYHNFGSLSLGLAF